MSKSTQFVTTSFFSKPSSLACCLGPHPTMSRNSIKCMACGRDNFTNLRGLTQHQRSSGNRSCYLQLFGGNNNNKNEASSSADFLLQCQTVRRGNNRSKRIKLNPIVGTGLQDLGAIPPNGMQEGSPDDFIIEEDEPDDPLFYQPDEDNLLWTGHH